MDCTSVIDRFSSAYLNIFFQKIGDAWVTDLSQLRKLEPFKGDKNLLVALQKVKTVCFTSDMY